MIIRIFRLVFLIAVTNSLVRINIWHDKLKQMCFSKGNSLYQELIDNQQNLSLHLSSFHLRNSENSSLMEECQNDSNSKSKLQIFFDAVQLCMDKQNRLLEDQKKIFVTKLGEVLCQLFLLGGGKIDEQCSSMTEINFSLCRQEFQEFPTILLPLIYNKEECSEARRLFDCFEDGTSECNDTTRNEFQAANNVTFYTLYGCQDVKPINESPKFKEEVIPNVNPEPDNEPSVRFNFTVIESSVEQIEDTRSLIQNHPMVRFNFTKTYLWKMCNESGREFSKDVENSFKEFLLVKSDKKFSIASLVKIRNLQAKNELEAVVNENCYRAPEIRNTLDKMFTAVEQCLNDEDRLEEEKKESLLNKSIDKFCSGLDIMGSLFPSDHECFHDSATFFQLALCSRNISVEQFYFDSLPLLFISSPEECNTLYRIQNCKLNVHQDCKNSTRSWLQEQFNQERRFVGCEDVLYEITSDN